MIYRPDLKNIEASYAKVLKHWEEIDNELDRKKIGRKDVAFNKTVMDNMLQGWDFLDHFIKKQDINLLSKEGGPSILEINNRVHYGVDYTLREEYQKAINANIEKFTKLIGPIRKYYKKNLKSSSTVYPVAAEIYISILGMPQLFIEGNHRSGSIVASWINLSNGKPPFVLTTENAIDFFKPAQAIKKFNKHSVWKSMTQLPEYKKSFKHFWKQHCDMHFVKK